MFVYYDSGNNRIAINLNNVQLIKCSNDSKYEIEFHFGNKFEIFSYKTEEDRDIAYEKIHLMMEKKEIALDISLISLEESKMEGSSNRF